MKVFTEDFIRKLEARYGSKDYVSQPRLFHIATTERGGPLRDKIERWASKVQEKILKALLPRLRHPDQFEHALNELIIAFHLSQLGYSLTYEPEIVGATPQEKITPDFLAERGDQKFVVEVFTRELSREEKVLESMKDDIERRIQGILVDVVLHVSYSKLRQALPPKSCKQIVAAVEKWLREKQPDEGDSFSVMNVKFKIFRRHSGRPNARVGLQTRIVGFVNFQVLREKIDSKVKKYGPLLTSKRLPYVIAIIPDFLSGLTFGSLQDALFGQEAVDVYAPEGHFRADMAQIVPGRAKGGLFNKPGYPLSAVLWIEERDGLLEMHVVANPEAPCLISEEYFRSR